MFLEMEDERLGGLRKANLSSLESNERMESNVFYE